MPKKDEKQEIVLNAAQAEKLTELLSSTPKPVKSQTVKQFFKNSFMKISRSFVDLFVQILTLKNTGKWISVLTVVIILSIIYEFLSTHNFSIEAMTLVIPYLGQIAITVFGIIGGFKGANNIIDKLKESKKVAEIAKEITHVESDKKQ